MKLIKPSVELIEEKHPLKRIERIGRMCYKSEDKITEESYQDFIPKLVDRKHFAMLEHARVIFEIRGLLRLPLMFVNQPAVTFTVKEDKAQNPIWYVSVSCSHLFQHRFDMDVSKDPETYTQLLWRMLYVAFITKYSNLTTQTEQAPGTCKYVIADNEQLEVKLIENIHDIIDFDELDEDLHDYMSIKFTCDRGVSHELVRHRVSVAQESTRYCNYASGKFGGEITFVEPADYDTWSDKMKQQFMLACRRSERSYMTMMEDGSMTPQKARAVLPNALKTDVVLTMTISQWKHFFNLRSLGTTGAPHPDMKVVADKARVFFDQHINQELDYIRSHSHPEDAQA